MRKELAGKKGSEEERQRTFYSPPSVFASLARVRKEMKEDGSDVTLMQRTSCIPKRTRVQRFYAKNA